MGGDMETASQDPSYFACSNPGCRAWGREFDADEAQAFNFVCLKCGQQLARTAVANGAPPDLDPAGMPTFLAHPWHEYLAEKHPRIKLHWLIDTAEVAIRWCSALAIAEVAHANGDVLPAALADGLRENILRP